MYAPILVEDRAIKIDKTNAITICNKFAYKLMLHNYNQAKNHCFLKLQSSLRNKN